MILKRHERPVISEENLAPVVQIITWLLFSFIILSVATRFTTKTIVTHRFRDLDDVLALVSLLFAVLQSICVLISTDTGLGRPLRSLSTDQLDSALKAQLAAQIFYTLALWASKASVLVFLHALTPFRKHRRILRVAGIVLSVWAVATIFSASFQCSAPRTWDYIHGKCFDRMAFQLYNSIFNIISELALVILPIVIILPLKTDLSRRVNLVACFFSRILVIGATLGQLIQLIRYFKSADPVLDIWAYLVCTQCVQALSIITACIPYLKPLLESLQAGALQTENAEMRVHATTMAYGTKIETIRQHRVATARAIAGIDHYQRHQQAEVDHVTIITTETKSMP